MRFKTLLAVALLVCMSGSVFAELQNVEIGGSLRIRGNYFNMDYSRVKGGYYYDASHNVETFGKHAFVEQRTRLNIKADFTRKSVPSSNSTTTTGGAMISGPLPDRFRLPFWTE